jgi:hypothetical protein
MTIVEEITALEAKLRDAEMQPDPEFFKTVLADDLVLNNRPGKDRVVDAHRAGETSKFTSVEFEDMQIKVFGNAAVVTCTGTFDGPGWTGTLRFMRVWLKLDGRWQIIAGSVST